MKLIFGHFFLIAEPNSKILVETTRKNIDLKYRLIFRIFENGNSLDKKQPSQKSKSNRSLNTDAEVFNLLLCSQIMKHLNGKMIVESPENIVPSFKLIF